MSRPQPRNILLTAAILFLFFVTFTAEDVFAQTPATVTVTCATAPPVSTEGKPILDDAAKSARADQDQAAIAAYKSLIARNLDVAYAYAGLTRVYLRQDDLGQAIGAAQAASAAAPNSIPAQVALGKVYFRQGKIPDAEHAFDLACGHDAEALVGLARIYEITTNHLMAAKALQAAQRLASDDPAIQYAWMYGSGNQSRRGASRELVRIKDDDASKSSDGDKTKTELTSGSGDAGQPSTPGCKVVSKPSSLQVNMEPQYSEGPGHNIGAYMLKVNIDGATTHLVVDSGADDILINHKTAAKAGIQPLAKAELGGIGDKGALASYVGFAKSVKIGDFELQGCYVTVAEDKIKMPDTDGLLGTVVFEDYLVEINIPDGKLKLSPLPPIPEQPAQKDDAALAEKMGFPAHNRYFPPDLKGFAGVYRFGSDIVIPTAVNSLANKLFILDTGGFDDVISPAIAREVTGVSGTDLITVKGVNGTVNKVGTADRLTLTFANIRQERSDTVTLSLDGISKDMRSEISGILGFGMLRYLDIKIDYRDALVSFLYNPNRLYH